MSTLLTGKRIEYRDQATTTKEGQVQGVVLMKERKDGEVISGYCILHDDGSLIHVPSWRLNRIVSQ